MYLYICFYIADGTGLNKTELNRHERITLLPLVGTFLETSHLLGIFAFLTTQKLHLNRGKSLAIF